MFLSGDVLVLVVTAADAAAVVTAPAFVVAAAAELLTNYAPSVISAWVQ
jgi:hypothetical protein